MNTLIVASLSFKDNVAFFRNVANSLLKEKKDLKIKNICKHLYEQNKKIDYDEYDLVFCDGDILFELSDVYRKIVLIPKTLELDETFCSYYEINPDDLRIFYDYAKKGELLLNSDYCSAILTHYESEQDVVKFLNSLQFDTDKLLERAKEDINSFVDSLERNDKDNIYNFIEDHVADEIIKLKTEHKID